MLSGRLLSYLKKTKISQNDYSLSFAVTRCYSLSLVVPLIITRCIIRLSFYKRSGIIMWCPENNGRVRLSTKFTSCNKVYYHQQKRYPYNWETTFQKKVNFLNELDLSEAIYHWHSFLWKYLRESRAISLEKTLPRIFTTKF